MSASNVQTDITMEEFLKGMYEQFKNFNSNGTGNGIGHGNDKSTTSSNSAGSTTYSFPDTAHEQPVKMDLRVDLYLQDAEETVHKGGHEFLEVHTNMTRPALIDSLQHQFKRLQTLPAHQRPNLEYDAIWSQEHKVSKIKVVSGSWDDPSKSSVITDENCPKVLRAIEKGRAPEALAIYISRPLY